MQRAKLSWSTGQPHCQRFDDIYFTEESLAESSYVFLGLNDLEEKFGSSKEDFTIAELGFGTGLNFFLSWRLFASKSNTDLKLNYISVEKFPLSLDELKKSWELWPELRQYSLELEAKLPNLQPGFHRVNLGDGRISLTLLYADVIEALKNIECKKVDAWFLDGFAPQKNPEMWSDEVLDGISRLSSNGTSLGTFTAAGFIKRGLSERGWEVQKVKGYGRKRDSIKAVFKKEREKSSRQPWFSLNNLKKQRNTEALVIGAGLAGCWTAYNLKRKGLKVTLIERNPEIAKAASGNPAGLALPYLSLENDLRHRFYIGAFDYSRRELKRFFPELDYQEGVIHKTDKTEEYRKSFAELSVPEELATIISEKEILFPKALRLPPAELCRKLLEGISVVVNSDAVSLERKESLWNLKSSSGVNFESELVVVCNSYDALNFSCLDWLPLNQVRGEVVVVEDPAPLKKADRPISGNSYFLPLGQNRYLIGSSYDYEFLDPEPSLEIQKKIFDKSQQEFGIFSENAKIISSRVGFRAATYDRIPYAGAVPDIDFMLDAYADYKKGFKAEEYPDCNYLNGLYVNVGHGSRGLVSAPVCAEIISSLIFSEPLPLEKDIIDSLMPNRWPVRQLARGHEVERNRSPVRR